MTELLPQWLTDPLLTSFFLAVGGFFLRGPIQTFFVRAVEHKFDEKLEQTKAVIRSNESELVAIRTFLTSRQSERQSVLEAKRQEASESLLQAANSLAPFNMYVETLKILKLDEISKATKDEGIEDFFIALEKGVKLDEQMEKFNSYDKGLARLYLSSEALSYFEAYTLIMTYSALYIKVLGQGFDIATIMQQDALSKKVIECVPSSKDGFEKYGEVNAFYWTQYLYDRMVEILRAEIAGSKQEEQDASTISRLTASSIRAQADARQLAANAKLPSKYVKSDTEIPVN